MADKLDKLEAKAAKERQGNPGQPRDRSGHLPERSKGNTRDKVGKAVGMGGSTYERAAAVSPTSARR